MADKELRARLTVTGENAAKAGLKNFGDEAAKAGDKIEDLAKDTDHLAESAANAEAEYKRLIKVFQETGDLDKKVLSKAKREMRFFENLQKELEAELKQAAIEVAAPGGGGSIIGEGIAKGMGAAIAAGGPMLIGSLAAVGALLTPFLGGVIASAVLGGTGIGGIVGGIALAAKDNRVEAAASNLAETAMTAFASAGEPFVAATVDSLHTLERASQDVAGSIGQGFRTIAPTLKPLTDGVIGLVNEAMPGLLKGFEAAKPVIRVIANELPEIGGALGDFFGIIGDDPDGAIMAFQTLSDIIQGTLRFTAVFINNMSRLYEGTVEAGSAISGVLEDILHWAAIIAPPLEFLSDIFGDNRDRMEELKQGLADAKDPSKDFAGNLRDIAKEADNAEQQLRDMKDASNDLFDVTMTLDKATIAYKSGIRELRDELLEGARTLDLNTEAGLANMETATNWIQLIEGMRDAEAESTLGIVEANKRYAERLEALKKEMLQMGYNKKAVEELIQKYLAVPKAIEVKLSMVQAGSAAAWSAFRAIERQQHEKNRTVGNVAFTEFIEQRAMGGPTRAGRTYVVGENGPELWSENANGFITPAGQTAALMSGRSGGAAMPMPSITRIPGGGDPGLEGLIDYLWPAFIKRAKVTGWPENARNA